MEETQLVPKLIKDLVCENEDHVVLNDVFVYIIPKDRRIGHVLYDLNFRYTHQPDWHGFEKHAIVSCPSPPNIQNTEYTTIDEAYSCLFNFISPPSHNFDQFVNSYEFLSKNKVKSVLIYNQPNNSLYTNFMQFATDYLIETDSVIKCSEGKLYKIKKLICGIGWRKKNNRGLPNFCSKLDEIIPDTGIRKKYFNLKLQSNLKDNWSGGRSFVNDDYITEVLSRKGYSPLNMSSEYSKQTELRNSSFLILNWGGNHIINLACLLNKNKPVLVLCHKAYHQEYSYRSLDVARVYSNRKGNVGDMIIRGNLVRLIFDMDSTIESLDSIIENFERDYSKYLQ